MNLCDPEFPAELHYLVAHQVWARLHDDGSATVGITALDIRLSGEIYMCRPKPVGSVVEQGRSVAVVELAKSIVSVKSAVSGTVLAVNPVLAHAPELVHADPYGQGWLALVRLSDWPADCRSLIQGDEVLPAMQAHCALYPDD